MNKKIDNLIERVGEMNEIADMMFIQSLTSSNETESNGTNSIIIDNFAYTFKGFALKFGQSVRSLPQHLQLLVQGKLNYSPIIQYLIDKNAKVYYKGNHIKLDFVNQYKNVRKRAKISVPI